jgi:hypothetical protein
MKRHPMTPIAPVQSLQMGLIASLLILSISACAPSKPSGSASPSPEVSTPPPSLSPSPTASPKPTVKPSGKEGASQSTGPTDTGTSDREPEGTGDTGNSGASSSAEVEAPVVPKVKAIEADVPAAKPIPRQADPAPRETEPEPRMAPIPRAEDPAPPAMAPKGSTSGAQEGPDPEPPAPNP